MTTAIQTPETLIDGPFGARLLIEADGFSLVEHPIAPHTLAGPSHVHEREDEYSYVLEGEVGFEVGDDVFSAGPGQLVAKPRSIWHAFWNAGDEPVRFLETIAPAGFEEYFFELAGPFNSGDEAGMGAVLGRYALDLRMETVPELVEQHGLRPPF